MKWVNICSQGNGVVRIKGSQTWIGDSSTNFINISTATNGSIDFGRSANTINMASDSTFTTVNIATASNMQGYVQIANGSGTQGSGGRGVYIGKLGVGEVRIEGYNSMIDCAAAGRVDVGTSSNTGSVSIGTGMTTGYVSVGGSSSTLYLNGKIVSNHLDASFNTRAPLASPTFTGVPSAPTAAVATNTTQIATTAFVAGEINALINSAPGALNTLNELATALGNDAAFSTTVTNLLASKAPLATPSFTGKIISAGDISLNNRLSVTSDSSFNGNLFIGGRIVNSWLDASLNSVMSSVAPSFTGLVRSAGDVSMNSRLSVLSDVSFTSNLFVGGAINNTGLTNALALKSDISGPTFTGVPKAPTASSGSNTTQLATTAFVYGEISSRASQWSVSGDTVSLVNGKATLTPILGYGNNGYATVGMSSTGQYLLMSVAFGEYNYAGMRYSSDYGKTINNLTLPVAPSGAHTFAFSTNGQYQLIGSGGAAANLIMRSNDYGSSFTVVLQDSVPIYNTGSFGKTCMSSTGQYIVTFGVFVNSGTPANSFLDVYTSNDYGVNFTKISNVIVGSGVSGVYGACMTADGSTVYMAISGKIYKSADYGGSWAVNVTSASVSGGGLMKISSNGQYIVFFAEFYASMFLSSNSGSSWALDTSWSGYNQAGFWGFNMTPDGRYRTYAFGGNYSTGLLYESFDYGATWTNQSILVGSGRNGYAKAIAISSNYANDPNNSYKFVGVVNNVSSNIYSGADTIYGYIQTQSLSKIFISNDVSMNSKLYVGSTSNMVGDVSMNSRVFVNGDVSFNSRLFVKNIATFDNDVSFNTDIFVGLDASLNSKLFVRGDVSMNSRLSVLSDVSFNGKLFVGSTLSTNTIEPSTITTDLNIGASQTSGFINIGTSNSRSGFINIGTGTSAKNIIIGSTSGGSTSIVEARITGGSSYLNPTSFVQLGEGQAGVDISMGTSQVSGRIDIGTKSDRTAAINIGTGASASKTISIGGALTTTNIGGNVNVGGNLIFNSPLYPNYTLTAVNSSFQYVGFQKTETATTTAFTTSASNIVSSSVSVIGVYQVEGWVAVNYSGTPASGTWIRLGLSTTSASFNSTMTNDGYVLSTGNSYFRITSVIQTSSSSNIYLIGQHGGTAPASTVTANVKITKLA
jgi:hypothetical protein